MSHGPPNLALIEALSAATLSVADIDWVRGPASLPPPQEALDALDWLSQADGHLHNGRTCDAWEAVRSAYAKLALVGADELLEPVLAQLERAMEAEDRTELDLPVMGEDSMRAVLG